MRLLVLTNFYPPYTIGGYERLCRDVVEGLKAYGHQVRVVTSTYQDSSTRLSTATVDVVRTLELDGNLLHYDPMAFFLRRPQLEKRNLRLFFQQLQEFEPDLVFVWGMWNFSRLLPWLAERTVGPSRVVYYVSDYWPADPDTHEVYWRDQPCHQPQRILKRLAGGIALGLMRLEGKPVRLRFVNTICVSHVVRDRLIQAGVVALQPVVIHNGIRLTAFPYRSPTVANRTDGPKFSLLYAGGLSHHKGVHTAIEAMHDLVSKNGVLSLTLTIAGSGHPSYETYLQRLVAQYNVGDCVSFCGRIPREEMPILLRSHDALVCPSVWEEPLAAIIQEAMAIGLPVIGTTAGGNREMLIEAQTGLTFAPGDATALAAQIVRLANDPDLSVHLAHNARRLVEQEFDIEQTIHKINAYLTEVFDRVRV